MVIVGIALQTDFQRGNAGMSALLADLSTEKSLDESIQVAVQDRLGIAHLIISAVVFDHRIGSGCPIQLSGTHRAALPSWHPLPAV